MVGKLVKITKIEAIKLWALRYDTYNFTDHNSYFYIVEAPNNNI